VTSHRL